VITTAERAALRAVLEHGTTKAAAAALGKSPRTVEKQLQTVRGRLAVDTTLQAVRRVFLDDE
jgi:DNA-binding CsgD family transcriptional regulator